MPFLLLGFLLSLCCSLLSLPFVSWLVRARSVHFIGLHGSKNVCFIHTGCIQRVWIMGDSIIRRAKNRADITGTAELGTTSTEILWLGQGGALLRDFPHRLQSLLQTYAPPSRLIIHLGSNDIGRFEARLGREAVKSCFAALRLALPCCHIAWSSILPRMVYRGWLKADSSQKALDGVRKSLNSFARRCMSKLENTSLILHSDIEASQSHLFLRDGVHLNTEGSDILIENFRVSLQAARYT